MTTPRSIVNRSCKSFRVTNPPNQKKPQTLKAVANTYEGESEVLYRVFTSDPKASVSCMDLVFSKGNAKVSQGSPVLSGRFRGLCGFVPAHSRHPFQIRKREKLSGRLFLWQRSRR